MSNSPFQHNRQELLQPPLHMHLSHRQVLLLQAGRVFKQNEFVYSFFIVRMNLSIVKSRCDQSNDPYCLFPSLCILSHRCSSYTILHKIGKRRFRECVFQSIHLLHAPRLAFSGVTWRELAQTLKLK